MLYGYSVNEINEFGLLELREVSLSASPAVLRQIAKFLLDSAALIEAGQIGPSAHRHIQSVIADWDRRFPDKDIIVIASGRSAGETDSDA
jgi:hypothetical protein